MEMQNFKNFINELADKSGDYIAKSFGQNFDVEYKNDASPVTEIDRNTEDMIRSMIEKKFPNHGIIGEEFGDEDMDAEFVWVVDPIDGTKSFISGVPLFGTLIGLMRDKKPILGLINQPVLKERMVGDCISASFNGKPVKASPLAELSKATLLSSDSRYPARFYDENKWRRLQNEVAIERTWGDCYGYMLVCRGLAHIMADAKLEVWDFTALLPILSGAGVSYSDWHGKQNIGGAGLVASCNKEMHKKVIDMLNT